MGDLPEKVISLSIRYHKVCMYLPKVTHSRCMCVAYVLCVCMCACVCVMESLLPQFQAWLIGAWCSVYTYTFANVQMYKCTYKVVWVCYIHPSQLQTLRVIDFMFSDLRPLLLQPRRAAVRMEGIKGEVTVMSKAACFPLSQTEDKCIRWPGMG